jgi:hypothetical protein
MTLRRVLQKNPRILYSQVLELVLMFLMFLVATITFAREHGLAGIVTGTITAGASYTNGTYQNLKLLNTSQTGTWQGATARVVVSGGGVVTSVDIVSSGSGYSAGPIIL